MGLYPPIRLKQGKDRKLANFYPYVFRDEVSKLPDFDEGIVQVESDEGRALALGYFDKHDRRVVAILTTNLAEVIDDTFFASRLHRARELRERLLPGITSFRACYAEADRLPGIIIDLYGGHAVLSIRHRAGEAFRALILRALESVWKPRSVWERSDGTLRETIGLAEVNVQRSGKTPEKLIIEEGDCQFIAALRDGHKTGYFLDQRENRALMRAITQPGMRALDAFAHTGSFACAMARAGARVTAIEKDGGAVARGKEGEVLNNFAQPITWIEDDCFTALPRLVAAAERFDLIVIDPPALAKSKTEVAGARSLFVRLAKHAFDLLEPGGHALFSSCAFHISLPLLEEAVRIGAGEAGKLVRVKQVTFQPADHPWIVQVPETLYLKSLLVEA